MLALAASALLSLNVNSCREIDIAFTVDDAFLARRCFDDAREARRYVAELVAEASDITAASLDARLRMESIRVGHGSIIGDGTPRVERQLQEIWRFWRGEERGDVHDDGHDLAIILSDVSSGAESRAQPGTVGTDEAVALLSDLHGLDPHSSQVSAELARRHDLVALLRAVATMCGAERSEARPQTERGSIMSRADEHLGGAANIDLRFDDRDIEAIWTRLAASPKPLGSGEQGVRAAPDVLVAVPGTIASIDLLANDQRINCGPVSIQSLDAATAGGWPLVLRPWFDAEGNEIGNRVVSWIPPNAAALGIGADSARYVVVDSEEATSIGTLEIVLRSADVTADGFVDAADLAEVMDRFGDSDRRATLVDFNGDGKVSGEDLGILLAAWQPRP